MSEQSELSENELAAAIERVESCLDSGQYLTIASSTAKLLLTAAKQYRELQSKLNEWSNKELLGETERCQWDADKKRLRELQEQLNTSHTSLINETSRHHATHLKLKELEQQFHELQEYKKRLREYCAGLEMERQHLKQQSRADKELIEMLKRELENAANTLEHAHIHLKDDESTGYTKGACKLRHESIRQILAHSQGYGQQKEK